MQFIQQLVYSTLFVLLFSLQLKAQHTQLAGKLKSIDSLVNRALKELHAPGCAVAVVYKQKLIYARGFGVKNIITKEPVDTNTVFAIGSCSKAFTASLIGWLYNDGKVDIDKPVRNYFSELLFENATLNNEVTLRDMMSHRTGMPRHDMTWENNTTTPLDSFMYRIRFLKSSMGLRQRWQYNNLMYAAQGALVEKITKKTFEQNIQEQFFNPLGMNNSSSIIKGLKHSQNKALPYYWSRKDSAIKPIDFLNLDNIGAAGSLNSNVSDMSKWLITWVNGGKYAGKEIIPSTHYTNAISTQMANSGPADPNFSDVFFSNYGLGWFISSYKGHFRVEHGGNVNGYSANVCFMPTDSIGIVVLSNQNHSSIPSIVRNSILDRLLNVTITDWTTRLKEAAAKAEALAKQKTMADTADINFLPVVHPLKDILGSYTNDGYGSLRIVKNNDSLQLIFNGNTFYLKHKTADIYNAIGDEAITDGEMIPINFRTNNNGLVTALSISNFEPAVDEIIFTRKVRTNTLPIDSLKKYIGHYDLNGATLKVYVKNNSLFLLVPGQPEYALENIEQHEFVFKTLSGFGVKFSIINDKPTSFLLKQPQGNFTAKIK